MSSLKCVSWNKRSNLVTFVQEFGNIKKTERVSTTLHKNFSPAETSHLEMCPKLEVALTSSSSQLRTASTIFSSVITYGAEGANEVEGEVEIEGVSEGDVLGMELGSFDIEGDSEGWLLGMPLNEGRLLYDGCSLGCSLGLADGCKLGDSEGMDVGYILRAGENNAC